MGDAADPREPRRTFIVPAIKPFDHYDFSRAKIACNLAWLVAKAFGTGRSPTDARIPRSCRVPGAPPCVSPAGAGGQAAPDGQEDRRDAAGLGETQRPCALSWALATFLFTGSQKWPFCVFLCMCVCEFF